MLRVCFLTHYFPPERGAPQTRIELLARTLAAAGHQITVHTGFPHYPSGNVAAPYRNRPFQRERRDGYTVLRSAVYPAANRGFSRRLADHLIFAGSALACVRLSGPADVVVVESPPLFTAAAGVTYAALKRAALVVNVADRWPASAVALGALGNRRAVAAAEALERWIYAHAEVITAPTAGLVAELGALEAAAGKLLRTWPVVDVDRFDPAPPRRDHEQPMRLLYAGTIGLAQGLETLVEASRLAGPEVVTTTLAGDGAELAQVRALVGDRRVPNVELLGAVDARRVPALYRETDAAAVLLRDLPLFHGALPTKLLEAMAAGRPLLLAARGEAAALVAEARAGLVVTPGDPTALAEAIRRLAAEPQLRERLGSSGRAFALAHFGASRAATQWDGVLDAAQARRHHHGDGAGAAAPIHVP